jgi:hypothetical protein
MKVCANKICVQHKCAQVAHLSKTFRYRNNKKVLNFIKFQVFRMSKIKFDMSWVKRRVVSHKFVDVSAEVAFHTVRWPEDRSFKYLLIILRRVEVWWNCSPGYNRSWNIQRSSSARKFNQHTSLFLDQTLLFVLRFKQFTLKSPCHLDTLLNFDVTYEIFTRSCQPVARKVKNVKREEKSKLSSVRLGWPRKCNQATKVPNRKRLAQKRDKRLQATCTDYLFLCVVSVLNYFLFWTAGKHKVGSETTPFRIKIK